tara:strand:+ start:2294 stop:2923 length:630 start_codon:yes stop_codon:yes gene_type:complete
MNKEYNMLKDREVPQLGVELKDKNILLMVTGGIASYKMPSLVRRFREHGAFVRVYLSKSAANPETSFVSKNALVWATGIDASDNPVVSELSPNSEHLVEPIDAYVVVPATYDIIGKFANGIADDVVSTTFASALGKLENKESSILINPTMHGSMQNSIYQENIDKLVSKGVEIIEPVYKYGKANLPNLMYIVNQTIESIDRRYLKNERR